MRLRVFLVLIGAILVIATYTFPYWQSLVQDTPEEIEVLFPGLPMDRQSAFASLPPEQQRAYLALAASSPSAAVRMVTTALETGIDLPEEDREMPEMNAPVPVAAGRFETLDAIRWGQGRVTVYQSVDNLFLLRFEDFRTLNGPDLRVALSAAETPATVAEMTANEVEPLQVSSLLSSFGNQNYELAAGFNLSPYRSVVIYSAALDMVYTYAPLSIRQ